MINGMKLMLALAILLSVSCTRDAGTPGEGTNTSSGIGTDGRGGGPAGTSGTSDVPTAPDRHQVPPTDGNQPGRTSTLPPGAGPTSGAAGTSDKGTSTGGR